MFYTGLSKHLRFFLNEGGLYFDKGTSRTNLQSERNQQQNTNNLYSGAQQQTNQRSNDTYSDSRAQGSDLWNRNSSIVDAQHHGINTDILGTMQGLGGSGGSSGGGGGGGNSSTGGRAPGDYGNFNAVYPYSSNLASTGGVDMGVLTATTGDYRKLADNPMDQSAQDAVHGDIGNLRTLASTGGVSDLDKNNYMGGGVYQQFADTGGFTPEQQNLYRQRATAMVPSMYQNMADEMARRRSVQGGYSPGFGASTAALARQGSQQMNDAARGAENDLQGQIRNNRMLGAQGLQSGQAAFTAQKTGTQLQAGQAASGLELGMQDALNKYKMSALGALTSENQSAQQIAQQGKIAGTGFLTAQGQSLTNQDIARNNAATQAGIANSQIAAANQRFALGLENENMMGGLHNMQGLYGSNAQQGVEYNQQYGNLIGGQAAANNAYFGNEDRASSNIPGMSNYLGMLGGMMPSFGGPNSGNPGGNTGPGGGNGDGMGDSTDNQNNPPTDDGMDNGGENNYAGYSFNSANPYNSNIRPMRY